MAHDTNVTSPVTVGDLIEYLQRCDDEIPVVMFAPPEAEGSFVALDEAMAEIPAFKDEKHVAPCGADFDTAEEAESHRLHCGACAGAEEAQVVSDPEVRGGTPVLRGTRITAEIISGLLADGMDEEGIVALYPGVTPDHIAALVQDADEGLQSERRVRRERGQEGWV